MKTKTLVRALTSLRMIPSSQDDFGGEVLPEGILLKNILLEMFSGTSVLFRLTDMLKQEEEEERLAEKLDAAQISIEMRDRLLRLRTVVVLLASSNNDNADGQYDADNETGAIDYRLLLACKKQQQQQKHQEKKPSGGKKWGKARSSISFGSSRKSSRSSHLWRSSPEGEFVSLSREVLLTAQNNRACAESLRRLLGIKVKEEGEEEEAGRVQEEEDAVSTFLSLLDQLHRHSVGRIMTPQGSYLQEVESLCGSIALKQKFEKIVRRLKTTLHEIDSASSEDVTQKQREKAELQEEIRLVRESSAQEIQERLEYAGSRFKVVAWNSHARQTKTLEQVSELRRELDEATDEHVEAETQMRRENLRLERELDEMIARYDAEMFQKHEATEKIGREYAREKEELRTLLEKLAVVEEERRVLESQQREEERSMIEQELDRIRRIVAAKTIQKAWRAHKTRMLLKSKKKKKKGGRVAGASHRLTAAAAAKA